jgi:hypothetical protein
MRSASTVLWRHSTGRRPITRRRKGRLGREVLPVIHVWDFTNPPVRLLGARNCKTSQTVTYHRAPGRERDRLRVTAGVRARKARTPHKGPHSAPARRQCSTRFHELRRYSCYKRGLGRFSKNLRCASAVSSDAANKCSCHRVRARLPKLPIRSLADAESESAVRLFGITSCSRGAFLLQSSPV